MVSLGEHPGYGTPRPRLQGWLRERVRLSKMLIYQMTRITSEKGCLRHDDRLDALAIAVGYFTDQMSRDEDMGIEMIRQEALEEELRRFMEHAMDPLGRSMKPSEGSWISRYTSMA